jgi:hypothetical protein
MILNTKNEKCEIAISKLRSKKKLLRAKLSDSIATEIKLFNNTKLEKSSNKSSAAWKLIKTLSGVVQENQSISSLNIN